MVRLVPGLVLVGVAQPEVCADIDHLQPLSDERSTRLGTGNRGKGRKDEIDALGELLGYGQVDRCQVRKGVAQLLAGAAAPGDAGELDLRVAVEQAGEPHARIPGDVDDADLEHESGSPPGVWGC